MIIMKPLVAGALALSVLAAPSAWAQSAQRSAESLSRSTDIPEERASTRPAAHGLDLKNLPAQELRNKPVYDAKSAKIATISDVTGTPGQTREAILQTGGVLGIGGREVALPLEKMSVGPDGKLVLNMTSDELKLLPRYR
jgi:hypothetical protein